MTSLQTQVCPGHVSLSQINPHPPPLSKQMYIPKTLICFASASKKKMARSNELLYQSFSILVFPPLDVLPLIISIFFLPSDVEVCSRAWCICFLGDPRWWLGHRSWLCGEFGNSFSWTVKGVGLTSGPLCNLRGGLGKDSLGLRQPSLWNWQLSGEGCMMAGVEEEGDRCRAVWHCDWWAMAGCAGSLLTYEPRFGLERYNLGDSEIVGDLRRIMWGMQYEGRFQSSPV